MVEKIFWIVQTGVGGLWVTPPSQRTTTSGLPVTHRGNGSLLHTWGGGLFIPRLFHYFPRFLLFICLCSIYLPIHLSSRGMKRGNSAVRLGEVNRALALGFPLSSIARGVHFPSGRQSTAVNRPVSLVRNSLC